MRASIFYGVVLFILSVGYGCGGSDNNGGGSNGRMDAGPRDAGFIDASGLFFADGGDGGGCVSGTRPAELIPADMIVMVDKSDSMRKKWAYVIPPLKSFFADEASKGIGASLHLFAGGAGSLDKCNQNLVPQFATPVVSIRELPEATAFAQALDRVTTFPNGTPTGPAIRGAASYADMIAVAGRKSVIVLVTDGEPTNCDPDGVPDVAREIAMKYPIYVVGLNRNATRLHNIAQAGGTGQAILVNGGTPEEVAAELRMALDTIRASVVSCDFIIPEPPEGFFLNLDKVNVVFTDPAAAPTVLERDATCAGMGWRYDNPDAPTKVELCPNTCETVRATLGSRIDVAFGCQTRVIVF